VPTDGWKPRVSSSSASFVASVFALWLDVTLFLGQYQSESPPRELQSMLKRQKKDNKANKYVHHATF
jgi:hypothetical protein